MAGHFSVTSSAAAPMAVPAVVSGECMCVYLVREEQKSSKLFDVLNELKCELPTNITLTPYQKGHKPLLIYLGSNLTIYFIVTYCNPSPYFRV